MDCSVSPVCSVGKWVWNPAFVSFVGFVVNPPGSVRLQPSGWTGVSSGLMRPILTLIFLSLGVVSAGAAGSPLLNRAAGPWLGEGNRWAFTVRVREFDRTEVKEDRVESYDPSKPEAEKWTLVTVDGQEPTDQRRQAWQKVKARRHFKTPLSLAEYLDFENVQIASFAAGSISYRLPLRSNRNWLFPLDHIALTVTVNRATHGIEEVMAGLDEPYHVAFGLARILAVDFAVKTNLSGQAGPVPGPAMARPQGRAQVVIARLGERIEYSWSDFRRVAPPVAVTVD